MLRKYKTDFTADDTKLPFKEWCELNFGQNKTEILINVIITVTVMSITAVFMLAVVYLVSLAFASLTEFLLSYLIDGSISEDVGYYLMWFSLLLGCFISLYGLLEFFLKISRLRLFRDDKEICHNSEV